MSAITQALNIGALIVIIVGIGVVANSKNSIGLVTAVGNMYTQSLATAASTIR